MATPISIGNDIVDLKERFNRTPSQRFIQRVCDSDEITWILSSPRSTHALWKIWTAKEAAYKAIVKIFPDIVFVHKDFKVDVASKSVTYGRHHIDVCWENTKHSIHCVAFLGGKPNLREETFRRIRRKTIRLEKKSVLLCEESVRVRDIAIELLGTTRELKAFPRDHSDIIFVKRDVLGNRLLPPKFQIGSTRLDHIDLSLSHDGRYISAVFLSR